MSWDIGLLGFCLVSSLIALGMAFYVLRADQVEALNQKEEEAKQTKQEADRESERFEAARQALRTMIGEIHAGKNELSTHTDAASISLNQTVAMLRNTIQATEEARALAIAVVDKAEIITRETDSKAMRISEITSWIDGIAFQTNTLALNAAIEAARAGEHGRGFAVVADELGRLAQRSLEATQSIKILLSEIGGQVSDTNLSGVEGSPTMEGLVASAHRMAELVAEVSAATEIQNNAIEAVSAAINEMEKVAQQNAATLEQSVRAYEVLQRQ